MDYGDTPSDYLHDPITLQIMQPNMTHNLLQECYLSTEHIASAVFVIFWLVPPIRERKHLCGLVKNIHFYCIYKF